MLNNSVNVSIDSVTETSPVHLNNVQKLKRRCTISLKNLSNGRSIVVRFSMVIYC